MSTTPSQVPPTVPPQTRRTLEGQTERPRPDPDRKRPRRPFDWSTLAWHGVVVLLATVYLLPLGWMVVSGFMNPQAAPQRVIPGVPMPEQTRDYQETIELWRPAENYRQAIHFGQKVPEAEDDPRSTWQVFWQSPYRKQMTNTLIIEVLGVVGMIFSSALAAYGFSRIRWPGRNIFFMITVATMMVPFAVMLVPLYSMYRWLGWIGTLKPLWAAAWFGGAFNIFLLRQFFMQIPNELSDAARIDGCSEFDIFLRIVLPLSKPALVVVGLFHFIYVWNDFFAPLVFLTEPDQFTLALGLHSFQSAHGGTQLNLMMAAATLVCIPVALLYFFTQRYFVQGIAMTGMKT